VIMYGRERSGRLTLWLRNRGTGDGNKCGGDGEGTDDGDENDFGEHGD